MSDQGNKRADGPFGLGRLFEELGAAVEKFSDLAERQETWSKTFRTDNPDLDAVVDVRIRTGTAAGGDAGASSAAASTGATETAGASEEASGREVPIQERPTPAVDVFDEGDHVLVVAEMPGIGVGDVEVEVDGDVLTLEAATPDRQYATEVLLPRPARAVAAIEANNGIIKIQCHT